MGAERIVFEIVRGVAGSRQVRDNVAEPVRGQFPKQFAHDVVIAGASMEQDDHGQIGAPGSGVPIGEFDFTGARNGSVGRFRRQSLHVHACGKRVRRVVKCDPKFRPEQEHRISGQDALPMNFHPKSEGRYLGLSDPGMTRVRFSLTTLGHQRDSMCSITNCVPRVWLTKGRVRGSYMESVRSRARAT